MTAEGHLLFSIAFSVFAKNDNLTYTLKNGDWWHIIPSAILTCLLPDIDHTKSFLGQQCKCISKLIAKICGHRGFTHSITAMFIIFSFLHFGILNLCNMPEDAIQGMELGYLSHIIADMLTPAGVPLLWPSHLRFRLPILPSQKQNSNLSEKILCIMILVWSVWMPQLMILTKEIWQFFLTYTKYYDIYYINILLHHIINYSYNDLM